MLLKNKKVLLDEYKVCVNVPMNTQIHKIVAEIFELNFSKYFYKYNMNISLDDILFISDSNTKNFIDIPRSYFEEFDKLSKGLGNNDDRILSIPSINAYMFDDKSYAKKVLEDHNRPSLIIIGFINNIPEHVYNNILDVFGRTKMFVFGDELVPSAEFGDYHNRILTNSEYSISHSYSDYRVSLHKKINSLMTKLRDKKTQNTTVIPMSTSVVKRRIETDIDINYIQEKLDGGYNIVVPRRLLPQINSRIKNSFGDSSEITCNVGDTFYTRFPFVTLDSEDNPIVIPPLSKVTVSISNDAETNRDGRRIILRNLIITKPNGSKVDLDNVPIDFTGYLMQFDENEHIDNYDDFNDILDNEDPIYFNPSTMSIIPHRIFSYVEQKYIPTFSMLVYLENFETEVAFKNRSLWFQDMFNVVDELEVIVSTKFNEL